MKKDNNGSAILAMAKKDLRALEGMVADREHFADEVFGFHAQQAVEKALKAWIAAMGKEYPFNHDISQLLGILKTNGIAIDEWMTLLELAGFSVQFRYEELDLDDEPLDRTALIDRIRQLIDRVAKEFC
jgi:HEPN domain-containing protein